MHWDKISICWAFWSLIVSCFALAVFVATSAMWLASRPLWQENERQAAESFLMAEATLIQRTIEPVSGLVEYLATEPSLVSFVIGDVENTDGIQARIADLRVPETIGAFEIYDFAANIKARVEGRDTPIANPDRAGAARVVIRALETARTEFLWLPDQPALDGASGWVAVAQPILSNGLAEGAIVAWVDLTNRAQSNILLNTDIKIEISSEGNSFKLSRGHDIEVGVPIGNTGLSLYSLHDEDAFANVGRAIVARTALALSASLLLPFAFFGWLGRKKILVPHSALEASRNQLREQQRELSQLAAIARKADEAIVISDLNARILWVNPAFERTTGYTRAEVLGRVAGKFLQGENTDPAQLQRISSSLKARQAIEVELINYTKEKKAVLDKIKHLTTFWR